MHHTLVLQDNLQRGQCAGCDSEVWQLLQPIQRISPVGDAVLSRERTDAVHANAYCSPPEKSILCRFVWWHQASQATRCLHGGFLISPTTTQKSERPKLFGSGDFCQGDVVGLECDFSLDSIMPLEIRNIVMGLHEKIKQTDVFEDRDEIQTELDTYIMSCALHAVKSPLVHMIPLELLITQRHERIVRVPDYDMGRVIRDIVLNHDCHINSPMFKIVQYCLPYIKHNRLNFPEYSTMHRLDLVNLMHIINATCFGIYRHAKRKPTWKIRVSIFWMTWRILECGNTMDMYIFCRHHMSLLRISIIEYFIYYMEMYMPVESSFMDRILGLNANVDFIFSQFMVVIDNFRQTALQDKTLDINEINAKAQIAIDKCNRICKGKTKCVTKRHAVMQRSNEIDVIRTAMRLPVFYSALQLLIYDNSLSETFARKVINIQKIFSFYMLPLNVQMIQLSCVLKKYDENTVGTYASTFLHYCLRCQEKHKPAILGAKMRINENTVSCVKCNGTECVVKICTVGRIFRIHEHAFFFCHICMRHHAWNQKNPDIFSCSRMKKKLSSEISPQVCLLCKRNTNMPKFVVLDDELGVFHTLSLCINHRPPTHEEHIVYNLPSFSMYLQGLLSKNNRFKKSY